MRGKVWQRTLRPNTCRQGMDRAGQRLGTLYKEGPVQSQGGWEIGQGRLRSTAGKAGGNRGPPHSGSARMGTGWGREDQGCCKQPASTAAYTGLTLILPLL